MGVVLKNIEEAIECLEKERLEYTLADLIGICAYYCKRFSYDEKQIFHDKIEFYLDRILRHIEKHPTNLTLENGLPLVYWLLDYLDKKNILDCEEDTLLFLHQQINKGVKFYTQKNNWVYLKGALGCLSVTENQKNYDYIIEYFYDRIRLFPEKPIDSSWYLNTNNFGLIYGLTGILYFINRAETYSSKYEKIQDIKTKLIDCILKEYALCGYIPAVNGAKKGRMCWCYGDLITCYQLYKTNDSNSLNQDLYNVSINLLDNSLKCNTLENSMIIDACVQHGAVGNYLLFSLLYQDTKLPECLEASELWKKYTYLFLEKYGYKMRNRYDGQLYVDLSLLTGLTGIYLSLLDFDEMWLKYLLLR